MSKIAEQITEFPALMRYIMEKPLLCHDLGPCDLGRRHRADYPDPGCTLSSLTLFS